MNITKVEAGNTMSKPGNCKVEIKDVLHMLTSQKFCDWYTNGNFDKWLTGDNKNGPTKEQIEKELLKMIDN